MAFERNDFRPRDDRWRDRDRGYGTPYGRDDERGFFDRAGDEVRSWFGDEEAERRREADARRYEREGGYRDRDFEDRWRADYGRGTGGGFGNQRGWNDRRWTGSYRDYDRAGRGSYDAADEFGGFDYGGGASGFGGIGGDRGRRFDRIDAGSVGTQGAHPMSAPAGSYYDPAYTRSSSAREAAIRRDADLHDRHYSDWRQRQMDALDSDYEDYRRENQSRFEQEFGSWREKRQGKRQFLNQITEHMEVVGSDGQHIGTVDHVRGDRILLTRNDARAGGRHHSIPCDWIDSVDDKVKIDKSAEEAMRRWREEERSRALFERDDQRQEGPHALERSFSGTYSNNR